MTSPDKFCDKTAIRISSQGYSFWTGGIELCFKGETVAKGTVRVEVFRDGYAPAYAYDSA